MGYLNDQANRMDKINYDDRTQLLALELKTILQNVPDPQTGPITINLGDGQPGIQLPASAVLSPLKDFVLPDLIFPDLILPKLQPQLSEDPLGDEGIPREGEPFYMSFKRTTTQEIHQRATIPAQITGGAGPDYSIAIYPNGSRGESFSHTGIELNGATGMAPGKWVLCFRHLQLELETNNFIKKNLLTKEEVIERTETNVKIIHSDHEFVRGGSGEGGGGGFPAQIISGGPGQEYVANIYPEGLSGSPETVNITQLQIDAMETLPAGTWCIAVKAGENYYCQVAVWL